MKRTLLVLSVLALGFFSNAQRSLDLELTLSAPQDDATIQSQQPYSLIVSIKNVDANADLLASDSIYYYLLMMGDTFTIVPGNTNHWEYTGNLVHPSESFGISKIMAFSDQFDGMDVDMCVYVKPVNQADPIDDPDHTNNMDCITVHVVGDNLSVGDNSADENQLFPNPANTYFLIKDPDADVSITDLNGKQLEFTRNSFGEVDCSNWKNGVYLVRISKSTGSIVKKIMVSH